jgi:short-subunit dehydrogenase
MQTVVILGTTSGLGLELAKLLDEHQIKLVTLDRCLKSEDVTTGRRASIAYDLQNGGFDSSSIPKDFLFEANLVTVVLNAATILPLGPAVTLSAAEIARTFQTNFFGYISVIQEFVNAMIKYDFKLRIVTIGTGATSRIIPGWFAYSASKATLESYLQFVALENPDVSITNFHPGAFQSKIQDEISKFSSCENHSAQLLPAATEAASTLADLILNNPRN